MRINSIKIAESPHYEVYSEFETVFFKNKGDWTHCDHRRFLRRGRKGCDFTG